MREIIPIPSRLILRPRDAKGYVVPFFAAQVKGEYDIRVADGSKFVQCVTKQLCWICGSRMGKNLTFVIGPMCALNRNTAEPPCHLECARYATKACPFLSRPKQLRNPADLPEDHRPPAGIMIPRNPGVVLLWNTSAYKVYRVNNGFLIQIGEPDSVEWYAEGRPATREEVLESIRTGIPILLKAAEEDGEEALAELNARQKQVENLLPEAL